MANSIGTQQPLHVYAYNCNQSPLFQQVQRSMLRAHEESQTNMDVNCSIALENSEVSSKLVVCWAVDWAWSADDSSDVRREKGEHYVSYSFFHRLLIH